jgi:hypothetical protein
MQQAHRQEKVWQWFSLGIKRKKGAIPVSQYLR